MIQNSSTFNIENSKLTKRIFLSPPHIGGEEIRFVKQPFESNYIAPLGPMVDAFEREFADYIGIRHCAAVSSGTAAMHLGLRHLLQRSEVGSFCLDIDVYWRCDAGLVSGS